MTTRIRCPHCGRDVAASTGREPTACPHCGAALRGAPRVDLKKRCPVCGIQFAAEKGVCPGCGASYVATRFELNNPDPDEGAVKKVAVRWGVVGGALMIAIAAVLFHFDPWDGPGLVLCGVGIYAVIRGFLTGNYSGEKGGERRRRAT